MVVESNVQGRRTRTELAAASRSATHAMQAASQRSAALARVDDESPPRNRSSPHADIEVPDSPEESWAAPKTSSSRPGRSLGLNKLRSRGAGNLHAQPRLQSLFPPATVQNQEVAGSSLSPGNSRGRSGEVDGFSLKTRREVAPLKPIRTDTPTGRGDHIEREFTSGLGGTVGAGHEQGPCGDDSAGFPEAGRQSEFCEGLRNSEFVGRNDQSAEPYVMEGNGESIARSSSPNRSFSSRYDALQIAREKSRSSGVSSRPDQNSRRNDEGVLSLFVTASLETISVSSATLAKAKVKRGDEDFMEAGLNGNLAGSSGVCVADGRQAPAVGHARISAANAIGLDHADGSDVEPNGNTAGPWKGCSADGPQFPAFKEAKLSSGNAFGLDDADGSDVMPLGCFESEHVNPIPPSSADFANPKCKTLLGDGGFLEIGIQEESAGRSKRCSAGSPQAPAFKRAKTSSRHVVGLDDNNEHREGMPLGCVNVKPISVSSASLTKDPAISNETNLSGCECNGNPGGPSEGCQMHGQGVPVIQRAEVPSGNAGRSDQTSGNGLAMFVTGNGTTISVSSAALARARAMFSGDDVPDFEPDGSPAGPSEGCSPQGGEALGFENRRTPPGNAVKLDHPDGSLEMEDDLRTFEARSGMMYSVSNEAISTAKAMLASAKSPSNKDVQGQRRNVEGKLNLKRTTAPFKPPRSLIPLTTSGDTTEKARSMRVAPFKPPRTQQKLAPSGDATEKAESSRADGDRRASSGAVIQSDCGEKPPARSEKPPIRGRERTRLQAVITGVKADDAEVYRIQFVAKDGMKSSAGALEMWRSLLALGVNGSYATKEWVANHYKWIVWKWGSFLSRNPGRAQELLTVESVLQRLKSRYEKESSSHRPAVMRVAEGSLTSAVTMILCVSAIRHYGGNVDVDRRSGRSIIAASTSDHAKERGDKAQQQSSEPAMVELTDGWYRLNAVLDTPLAKLLQEGKLKAGQNLQICGASLRSRSDGASPLEAFHENVLKIHKNGTYRARHDKRLGICKDPFIPLSFDYIEPDGGVVPQTLFGVTRVYPFLYMETQGKGISIIRSVRAEERAINNFANRRAKVIDEAVSRAEKLALIPEEMDEDEKLFDLVENSSDPEYLLAGMTLEQIRAFPASKARKENRKREIIDNAVKDGLREAGLESRDVRRLLKVRVVGLRGRREGDLLEDRQIKEGTVTLWDISDEQPPIDEGSVYRVSGLKPATWSATRNVNHIQLNSYASTRWEAIGEFAYARDFLFAHSPRKAMRLCEMDDSFVNREFDIVAIVVEVGEPFPTGAHMNQWIFVTDGTAAKSRPGDEWVETQILAIRFSLRSDAFVPIQTSTVGSMVAVANLLQKPKDRRNHIWVAEATELVVFSSNLKDPHLQHLQNAGACVQEWLNPHRMIVADLKYHVQSFISSQSPW